MTRTLPATVDGVLQKFFQKIERFSTSFALTICSDWQFAHRFLQGRIFQVTFSDTINSFSPTQDSMTSIGSSLKQI